MRRAGARDEGKILLQFNGFISFVQTLFDNNIFIAQWQKMYKIGSREREARERSHTRGLFLTIFRTAPKSSTLLTCPFATTRAKISSTQTRDTFGLSDFNHFGFIPSLKPRE
jgi:hypothetical protein